MNTSVNVASEQSSRSRSLIEPFHSVDIGTLFTFTDGCQWFRKVSDDGYVRHLSYNSNVIHLSDTNRLCEVYNGETNN